MNATTIDWCAYRSKEGPEALFNTLNCLFDAIDQDEFRAVPQARGWMGYTETHSLELRGKKLGFIASGGKAQRGWSQVNLTGDAIGHIPEPAQRLTDAVYKDRAQFKRVDIALTTSDGSVNYQRCLDAYRSGGFDTTNNRPQARKIEPEDSTTGRTLYVGNRTSPKFNRMYEKGLQLLERWNLAFAEGKDLRPDEQLCLANGRLFADLFRCELELKLDPESFPEDILTNSDAYFAGAYPFYASLVAAKPETFVLTPQRLAELDMSQSLACIRQQWGPTLFTALALHHGDYMAVWQKIVGRHHSKSLLERGVMFAEFE